MAHSPWPWLVGFFAVWSLLVDTGLVAHRALAGPLATLRTLASDLARGSLLGDTLATSARVCAGVTIGLLLGAAVGGFLGVHRAARRVLEPGLDFLRAVPPLLVFSLLLLALGYGESARVGCVALSSALVVSLHAAAALASIDPRRVRLLQVMGASPRSLLRYLYVYEAAPACLLAARQAVSTGLVVAVVTEMIVGAPAGLGTRALDAQIAYDAPRLYAVMLITGVLGQLATHALLAAERRLRERWR